MDFLKSNLFFRFLSRQSGCDCLFDDRIEVCKVHFRLFKLFPVFHESTTVVQEENANPACLFRNKLCRNCSFKCITKISKCCAFFD